MVQFGYFRFVHQPWVVATALVKELVASRFQGYSALRTVPIRDVSGKFYLSEAPGGGCYLWELIRDNTSLYEALSRNLDSPIHVLDVNEDVRTFLYLRYNGGQLVCRRLEPERLFVSFALDLRDLEYGPRTVETAAAFLRAIEPEYVPDLDLWHFGQWADPEWREEILAHPKNRVQRAVELDLGIARRTVSFLGKWSDSERKAWVDAVLPTASPNIRENR